MKKLLTLLLALSMLLPILASCGESEESKGGGGTAILGEGWWNGLDFNGSEVFIVYPPDGLFESQATIYSEQYQKGPEQIGADDVKNLCYNRNQDVCATLNLSIRWGDPTASMTLDEWSKMATGAPDMAYLTTNKLNSNLLAGYLYNVHCQDEKNYFDFSNECWYNDFMDTFTLDQNKHYGVAGDYFLSVMQAANAVFMNTEYYETNVATYWYSLDELVAIVEARQFNCDEFVELIERGWVSKTGKSEAAEGDGLGLIAHSSTWLYPFIYSVDDYVFTKDKNGEIQMVETANALYTIIECVLDIYGADGTCSGLRGDAAAANASDYIDLFTAGDALFIEGLSIGDLQDNRLLAMEKKIALPYPILIETQTEYRTYVSLQAQLGAILKNTRNFSACTALMQLLNEQSVSIVNEYFNYSLKFKYSTDSTGISMLDIIHDTIGSSFNKIMSDNVKSYSTASTRIIGIVTSCVSSGSNNAISQYDGVKDAYKEGLIQLKKAFKELD